MAGVVLMILGVALYASTTGTITSLLLGDRDHRGDVPDLIKRLSDLRESGAITQEEYEAKKQKLLEQI
jgi:hypothetical protein